VRIYYVLLQQRSTAVQHQNHQQYDDHVARAKRILNARAQGAEHAQRDEWDVGINLLGELASGTEPGPTFSSHFQASEVVGKCLHEALTQYANQVGLKPPAAGTYDPLFSTATMFRDVWRLREVIEQTEIAYARYIGSAVEYWSGTGKKRMPRPSQLSRPDVMAYVMGRCYKHRATAA
jgi:hypothetical protein